MKLLTCHNGQLHAAHSELGAGSDSSRRLFVTGFAALDEIAPNGTFARGAMHELLSIPSHPSPFFVALFLAKASMIQPQMNADERRLKNKRKDLATDGAPTDTDENQIQISYRCPSVPHRWLKINLRSSAFICSSKSLRGAIVWCDPQGKLYPPAVAAMGVPLDRLFLLRPKIDPR